MDCCLKQLHRFCHRKVHALAVFGHMKYRDFLLGIPCLTALLILLPDLAADVFVLALRKLVAQLVQHVLHVFLQRLIF